MGLWGQFTGSVDLEQSASPLSLLPSLGDGGRAGAPLPTPGLTGEVTEALSTRAQHCSDMDPCSITQDTLPQAAVDRKPWSKVCHLVGRLSLRELSSRAVVPGGLALATVNRDPDTGFLPLPYGGSWNHIPDGPAHPLVSEASRRAGLLPPRRSPGKILFISPAGRTAHW